MRNLALLVCALVLSACSDTKPSEKDIEASLNLNLPAVAEVAGVTAGDPADREIKGKPVVAQRIQGELRYKEDTFVPVGQVGDRTIVARAHVKGSLVPFVGQAVSYKADNGKWIINVVGFDTPSDGSAVGGALSEFPAGTLIEGSDEAAEAMADHQIALEKQRIEDELAAEAAKEKAKADAIAAQEKAKQKVIDDEVLLKKIIASGNVYKSTISDETVKFMPVPGSATAFKGTSSSVGSWTGECSYKISGQIEGDQLTYNEDAEAVICSDREWVFKISDDGKLVGKGVYGNGVYRASYDVY
jgi:hypothetical protein